MSMWRKAGRPRKTIIGELDELDDSKWTRDELTIKHGEIDLAIAVVKQWHLDGCPASDYAGVEPWLSIIISALDNKNSKLGVSKIGGNSE